MKIKTYKTAKSLIKSIDMDEYKKFTGLDSEKIVELINTLIEYTDMVLVGGPTEASQEGITVTKHKDKTYSIRTFKFDDE